MCVCVRPSIHPFVHPCMRACVRACVRAHVRACVRAVGLCFAHTLRDVTGRWAEHNNNNIVGFERVADKDGLREWMRRLHWMPAEYHMGYAKTYALVLDKLGVLVNLHQNTACKAKAGWMPVADGMKAVSEIAHIVV